VTTFVIGQTYELSWQCRDIGYGTESGHGTFRYWGVETFGKHTWEPTNGNPYIYLFDDEILTAEIRL
jgi:hypothetical protein